jgi:hypothetical protein
VKLESLEKGEKVRLDGIAVEVQYEDGSPQIVKLRGKSGQMYVIRTSQYGSGLKIMRPAKPKLVKRHQVVAKIGDREVVLSDHEERFEALAARDNLPAVDEDAFITVREVEVEEAP